MDQPPGLERVRAICRSLPETEERLSHGEPSWFVGSRLYATFSDHHHDDRVAVWCAAAPGVRESLVESAPHRFFRPPYVGHRGWLGIYLDVPVDWDEVGAILKDAHQLIAAKSTRRR